MPVFYCPNCGNVTEYGKFDLISDKVREIIKMGILSNEIKEEETKLCPVCERLLSGCNKPPITESNNFDVNHCLTCFDLEINSEWIGFSDGQKEKLREAFNHGRIFLSGSGVKECPKCKDAREFIEERTTNLYDDDYKPFTAKGGKNA